jgi:Domain of unknown function (DUF4282)
LIIQTSIEPPKRRRYSVLGQLRVAVAQHRLAQSRGATGSGFYILHQDIDGAPAPGGGPMLDYRDLFQWERFITPSIIKIFYWLSVGLSVLFGLSGMLSGLALMVHSLLSGLFMIIGSLIGMIIGVIFARIISEFVLIMFRINEHLGAIRQRGQPM